MAMTHAKPILPLVLGSLLLAGTAAHSAVPDLGIRAVWPQCERLETAILKPAQAPEFSWGLDADGRDGAAQTACQIKVATPGGETIWDSGKVASDDTLDVPYAGPALGSASPGSVRIEFVNK
jgi:alpha-L-rhamnosidase